MNKWHARIEPKGYKCARKMHYEYVKYIDEDGYQREELNGAGYMADGCKTVDISLHQYQCTICGTIGNY